MFFKLRQASGFSGFAGKMQQQAKTGAKSPVTADGEETNTSHVGQGAGRAGIKHPIIARLLTGARKAKEVTKPKTRDGVTGKNVIQRVLAAARRDSHKPSVFHGRERQQTKEHKEAQQNPVLLDAEQHNLPETQDNTAISLHGNGSIADQTAAAELQRPDKEVALSERTINMSELDKDGAGASDGDLRSVDASARMESIPGTPSVCSGQQGTDQPRNAAAELAYSDGDCQAPTQGTTITSSTPLYVEVLLSFCELCQN